MSKKSGNYSVVYVTVFAAVIVGCSIDQAEERGQLCPPEAFRDQALSYIQMDKDLVSTPSNALTIGHSEYFNAKVCPYEFKGCFQDTSKRFYCMNACQSDRVACDGKCIDPDTDRTYCGAKNDCTSGQYGCCSDFKTCKDWEDCVDGACRNKIVPDGTTRCTDGRLYTYSLEDNYWQLTLTCRDQKCNSEGTDCATDAGCSYKSVRYANLALICSKDEQNVVLQCVDGEIQTLKTCAEGKICDLKAEDRCSEYKACIVDGQVVAHKSAVCENNYIKTCFDGELLNDYACPSVEEPEKTLCRGGVCINPDCTWEGVTVKDGRSICTQNVVQTCREGEWIKQDCTEISGICSETDVEPACLPQFRSVKAIRNAYSTLMTKENCNNGKEPSADGECQIVADVQVEGVVTALRTKSGNYGIVLQEIAEDPTYSGIIVNSRKENAGLKYPDQTDIKVGDYVRVISDRLNGYYGQLQIYQKEGDIRIEKLGENKVITPFVIQADALNTVEEYEPNNPYNSVLVTIPVVTAVSYQTSRPEGWKALDENAKDVIVSPIIYRDTTGEAEAFPIAADKTYSITGVGVWSFNESTLAVRTQEDIVEVPDCAPGQSGSICLKRKGESWATSCVNGTRDTADDVNCSASGKLCYRYQNGAKEETACREESTCTDVASNKISEDSVGCATDDALATCVYNESCSGNSCAQGRWEMLATCGNGCDPVKKVCNPPKIKECGFTLLDEQTHKAAVRIKKPDDSTVRGSILCTLAPTEPILSWVNRAVTTQVTCADCASGVMEFATTDLPTQEGEYACVAVATLEGAVLRRYVCPTAYGEAVEIDSSKTAEDQWIRKYRVGAQRDTLAAWNFTAQCSAPSSGVKMSAIFSLSTGNFNCQNGYAAQQAAWGKSIIPDWQNDPHWEIQIDTKGYKDISLSFQSRSSKTDNMVLAAYKVDGGSFERFGEPFTLQTIMTDYPETKLPAAASDQERIVIGIFPYHTDYSGSQGPNIRIDNLEIRGVKQ